ncbi:Cof-type HAD-IIB family hydrolase [Salinispira pacifica]
MYRLLATDIDDTLLAPDGSLPEINRTELLKLHASGVAIVFCSGRADASIRKVAQGILPPADDEYLIAFNGARVVTADTRRTVARQYLPTSVVESIRSYARANNLHLQAYEGDDFLVERVTDAARAYAKATSTSFRRVDDLAAALPVGSPKLLLIGEHELLASHRDAIQRAGGRVQVMFSKPHYLEIVAEGVNKGSALTRLAAELGIAIEETVAVGDAANDVDMLRAAGVGVAVANAHSEALSAADIVLETDATDGVMAEVARRFFS